MIKIQHGPKPQLAIAEKLKKKRILITNKAHHDFKNDPRKKHVIFSSGLNTKLKIELLKTEFDVEGIPLYDNGRNSLITTAMYNEIKTLLHFEKPGTTSAPEDSGILGSEVSTSQTSLLLTILLLSMALILN